MSRIAACHPSSVFRLPSSFIRETYFSTQVKPCVYGWINLRFNLNLNLNLSFTTFAT